MVLKHWRVNAQAAAAFLQSHPDVDQMYYTGLKTHFNYAIAVQTIKRFLAALFLFSLGSVKACMPPGT